MKQSLKDKDARKKAIWRAVESVFAGVEHRVSVQTGKANICVMIEYTDFKPREEVRRLLRPFIGEGVQLVLVREYSDKTIRDALYKMFYDNEVGIVYFENGKLECLQIRVYVNDMLDNMCSA